ncbi:MAG: integral rane protein [Polaromonas sp.]|nr:integral rane protein [Polaromonas sp.]
MNGQLPLTLQPIVPHSPVPPPASLPPPLAPGALALPAIRSIGLAQPFGWLARGARDMRRGGWLSLAHGVVPAAFGGLLVALAGHHFWLLAGAFSGFLVVAPVLATSLYAISRAIERGEPVNLQLIIKTWTRWQYSRYAVSGGYWSLVRFGLLLALAGTGWVLTSAALITLLAVQPVNTPMDFLRHVVLAPGHHVFELWLTLGGLLAAPIFASSVIAMPLLLDRRVDVLQAVLASWQAVLTNPAALALWAALIMGLSLLGLATLLLGLVVVLPLLGHASWHAYRDLVEPGTLPERLPPEDAA